MKISYLVSNQERLGEKTNFDASRWNKIQEHCDSKNESKTNMRNPDYSRFGSTYQIKITVVLGYLSNKTIIINIKLWKVSNKYMLKQSRSLTT